MLLHTRSKHKLKRLCLQAKSARELFLLTRFLIQHPSSKSIRRQALSTLLRYASLFDPIAITIAISSIPTECV